MLKKRNKVLYLIKGAARTHAPLPQIMT